MPLAAASRGRPGCVRAGDEHVLHGLQLRQVRREQADQRVVDDDDLVLGVVGDVDELLGEQPDVQRVQHGAHRGDREVGLEVLGVVPLEGRRPAGRRRSRASAVRWRASRRDCPARAYVWERTPSAVAVITSASACTVVPCFISEPMVSGKSCMVLRIEGLRGISSRQAGAFQSLAYDAPQIQTHRLVLFAAGGYTARDRGSGTTDHPGEHMRIVITGASGNLGSALVRRLGGRRATTSSASPADAPENYGAVRTSHVGHPLDLTEDSAVRGADGMSFAGADAVVHLAWGFQPSHDLAYLEELGVGGTRRVVVEAVAASERSRTWCTCRRWAPTPPRHGRPPGGRVLARGMACRPSPYSQHKAAAERLLDAHRARPSPSLSITRIRPGIIGQRDSRERTAALRRPRRGALDACCSRVPVLPLDRGPARCRWCTRTTWPTRSQRVLDRSGRRVPFNLAADPPVTDETRSPSVLGARPVHVPRASRACSRGRGLARPAPAGRPRLGRPRLRLTAARHHPRLAGAGLVTVGRRSDRLPRDRRRDAGRRLGRHPGTATPLNSRIAARRRTTGAGQRAAPSLKPTLNPSHSAQSWRGCAGTITAFRASALARSPLTLRAPASTPRTGCSWPRESERARGAGSRAPRP